MYVYSELLGGGAPCGLGVWSDSIKRWKPPYDAEEIDAVKRKVILENIRRAIQFKGDDIEVIG